MNSNHFIKSLPLVASALSRKYGIKVAIGGNRAATNGKTISLPSLPLHSPPELINLASGFIDHEAAHLRDTNFRQMKSAGLNPLEFHIFNIIEDWRVERVLGDLFPGCRYNFQWLNFQWLIKHFFDQGQTEETTLDQDILHWMLLEVRSWAVPELQARVEALPAFLFKA